MSGTGLGEEAAPVDCSSSVPQGKGMAEPQPAKSPVSGTGDRATAIWQLRASLWPENHVVSEPQNDFEERKDCRIPMKQMG